MIYFLNADVPGRKLWNYQKVHDSLLHPDWEYHVIITIIKSPVLTTSTDHEY